MFEWELTLEVALALALELAVFDGNCEAVRLARLNHWFWFSLSLSFSEWHSPGSRKMDFGDARGQRWRTAHHVIPHEMKGDGTHKMPPRTEKVRASVVAKRGGGGGKKIGGDD